MMAPLFYRLLINPVRRYWEDRSVEEASTVRQWMKWWAA